MEIHESGEDYLERILILSQESGYARSIDIAAALHFSKPSVSVAMKTLRERGFITMDAESHIRLTESGTVVAERIYDRHRRLTAFLTSLGVSEATAREDACKMEHDLSEETYRAICRQVK